MKIAKYILFLLLGAGGLTTRLFRQRRLRTGRTRGRGMPAGLFLQGQPI